MILKHSTQKEEMVYILEWMNFCLSIEREVFLLRGKMRLKSYMTFRQDGGVGYNIRSLLHFLFLPFFYARAYSENRNVENFLRLS